MHPAFVEALASQRTAELRTTVGSCHRAAARSNGPASSIRQRVGWVLVQVGLRLAVRQVRV
jgi:hypothetical protein